MEFHMKVYMVAILILLGLLAGQSTGQQSRYDVACKNLRFVPSKPHVGDRLWVRFEVANLSALDIPGKCVDVSLYLDDKKIVWSGGYPHPLKAHATTYHSVAEQYMQPLTTAGPHKYRLVVTLQKGAVDVDTTNNVIEGVLNVLE